MWEERYHHWDGYVLGGLGEVLVTKFSQKEDVVVLFSFEKKFCTIVDDVKPTNELIGMDASIEGDQSAENISKRYNFPVVCGQALFFMNTGQATKGLASTSPFKGTAWEFVQKNVQLESYQYLFDCASCAWSVANKTYGQQLGWIPLDKVLILERALDGIENDPQEKTHFLNYMAINDEMQGHPYWQDYVEDKTENIANQLKIAQAQLQEKILLDNITTPQKHANKKI